MFLYAIIGDTPVDAGRLNAIGLGHIIDAPGDLITRQVMRGPWGGAAFVAASRLSVDEHSVGCFEDRQEWIEFDGFWIGRDRTAYPDISRLARPKQLDGVEWIDWQGNRWLVPIARKWTADYRHLSALPHYYGIAKDGTWKIAGVETRYESLWQLAMEIDDNRTAALEAADKAGLTSYSFDLPNLDRVCSIVLGANYRVSKYEVGILNSIQQTSCQEICSIVVDDAGLAELQKKTAHDRGTGLSGPAAS